MTLVRGDVISTGTAPEVGLGQRPPLYLKPGDIVERGIEGLGRQRQHVVALMRVRLRCCREIISNMEFGL